MIGRNRENLAQVIRGERGKNWFGKGNESHGHDWINHRTYKFAPIMSEASRDSTDSSWHCLCESTSLSNTRSPSS